MQQVDGIWDSPSFRSYVSDEMEETVEKILKEMAENDDQEEFQFNVTFEEKHEESYDHRLKKLREDDNDDFEFATLQVEQQLDPLSTIHNQNRSMHTENREEIQDSIWFPIRDHINNSYDDLKSMSSSSSSFSSVDDEIDVVPLGRYCVRYPKSKKSENNRVKSKSTGTSRRWSIKDLLIRSNSERETIARVFTAPKPETRNNSNKSRKLPGETKTKIDIIYSKNGSIRETNGRRLSFLPYRIDLFPSMTIRKFRFPF